MIRKAHVEPNFLVITAALLKYFAMLMRILPKLAPAFAETILKLPPTPWCIT